MVWPVTDDSQVMQRLQWIYLHHKFMHISSYLPNICPFHRFIRAAGTWDNHLLSLATTRIKDNKLFNDKLGSNEFMNQRHIDFIENVYRPLRAYQYPLFVEVDNTRRIAHRDGKVGLKLILI